MRQPLRMLAAAVGVALCLATPMTAPMAAATEPESVSNAYLHLDEAMDEWDVAPNLRMPSSFHRGFLEFWDNSVTYDSALMIIAYVNRKDSPDSLERARTMGDALLQMQQKDPIGDGRVRNAYGPEHLFDANGVPNIQTPGSAAGNQAWAGMALAHLAHVTGEEKYLDGAERIGDWLIKETWNTVGPGGFTGGYNSQAERIEWKSTEHNIDMVGLFGMLHQLTWDRKWACAKFHARRFVHSMWDRREGRFHIGTTDDGVTINRSEFIPEDTQSWGYLAMRSNRYRRGLDWNIANLEVTDHSNPDHPIRGVGYAKQINPKMLDHNDDTVWLEGNAHMALALKVSGRRRHLERACLYLDNIRLEQLHGDDADGKGIPAGSTKGYAGGEDLYFSSLHTGATAWYIMAEQGLNPFHQAKRARK